MELGDKIRFLQDEKHIKSKGGGKSTGISKRGSPMKLRAQGMLNEEKLDETDAADATEHNPADHGGCIRVSQGEGWV